MHKRGSYKIGKFTSISENSPRDLMKPEFIKLQTQHNNAAAWCLHSIWKATNPKATHKYKYSHHAFHKYKGKGFTNCLTKLAPHQKLFLLVLPSMKICSCHTWQSTINKPYPVAPRSLTNRDHMAAVVKSLRSTDNLPFKRGHILAFSNSPKSGCNNKKNRRKRISIRVSISAPK